MSARRIAAGAAAALALAGGAAVARSDGPATVVALERGGTAAELRLPRDGAFALAYRHSVHRRPAVERFRALPGGGFELVAISSPSQGVLDYYEAEGRRSRRGGWWTLRLARPARFERMPLAATAVGRRTLLAGGARVPLWGSGRARHLTIAVEGS